MKKTLILGMLLSQSLSFAQGTTGTGDVGSVGSRRIDYYSAPRACFKNISEKVHSTNPGLSTNEYPDLEQRVDWNNCEVVNTRVDKDWGDIITLKYIGFKNEFVIPKLINIFNKARGDDNTYRQNLITEFTPLIGSELRSSGGLRAEYKWRIEMRSVVKSGSTIKYSGTYLGDINSYVGFGIDYFAALDHVSRITTMNIKTEMNQSKSFEWTMGADGILKGKNMIQEKRDHTLLLQDAKQNVLATSETFSDPVKADSYETDVIDEMDDLFEIINAQIKEGRISKQELSQNVQKISSNIKNHDAQMLFAVGTYLITDMNSNLAVSKTVQNEFILFVDSFLKELEEQLKESSTPEERKAIVQALRSKYLSSFMGSEAKANPEAIKTMKNLEQLANQLEKARFSEVRLKVKAFIKNLVKKAAKDPGAMKALATLAGISHEGRDVEMSEKAEAEFARALSQLVMMSIK